MSYLNLEQEIKDLIAELDAPNYDNEGAHVRYDDLLEKFILNYDPALLPLMRRLIELEKDFWYA